MEQKCKGAGSGVSGASGHSKVVAPDFEKNRLENSPHLAGKGICLNCKHTWQGVVPLGCWTLVCPKCDLAHGVLESSPTPHETWACQCGCVHFYIHPEGTMCAHCGLNQNFG